MSLLATQDPQLAKNYGGPFCKANHLDGLEIAHYHFKLHITSVTYHNVKYFI